MNSIKKPIILMYHGIVSQSSVIPNDREMGAELYDVDSQNFCVQMEYLKSNNFPVTLWHSRDKSTPKQKIIITFDDGESNNFSEALPILKRLGFPAYFFITANRIGKPGYLNWTQLIELKRGGMIIGSHGLNHNILTQLSDEELIKEFSGSKAILEKGLHSPVYEVSIPRGFYDNHVLKVAKETGYKDIFISGKPRHVSLECIGRVAIKKNWTLKKFQQTVNDQIPISQTAFEIMRDFSKKLLGSARYDQLRSTLLKSKR